MKDTPERKRTGNKTPKRHHPTKNRADLRRQRAYDRGGTRPKERE